MPNQPKPGTQMRGFRCENALWDRAKAKAEREDKKISAVLRELLEAYVEGPDAPATARPED